MKNKPKMKFYTMLVCLLSVTIANSVSAHSVGGPLDSGNNNASATDYGYVYCSNDGNGDADHLFVQIQDFSPPVPGLLLSVQVSKGNQMQNITDTVSGDGQPSPTISVKGGNGVYTISINKTNVGLRNFELTYHCLTADNVHTGTDIGAYQLQ